MFKLNHSLIMSGLLLSIFVSGGQSHAAPKEAIIEPVPIVSPSEGSSASTLKPFRLAHMPKLPKVPLMSLKGTQIEIYQFGQGSDEYVFLLGNFHGDEPQGEHLLRQLMLELVQKPNEYTNKTIFCMPLVNPDGTFKKTRVNNNGVDLNRNFPTKNFIQGQHKGTRYYAGPNALSEPESRIVSELIKPYLETGKREKVKILSIHSPLAVNNFDGPALHIAQAMQKENRLKATGSIGYPTPGSFGTYYGTELGIPVVTLETTRQSGPEAWKAHRNALWAFLNTPVAPPTKADSPPKRRSFLPAPMAKLAPIGLQTYFPLLRCDSQELFLFSDLDKEQEWAPYLNCPFLLSEQQEKATLDEIFDLEGFPSSFPTQPTPTPLPTPKPTATPLPVLSSKAVVYISKKNQRLTLKDGDKMILTVPVSTARYSVSTPVGKFRIVSKDENPSYSGRHGYYPPKHPKNPLGSRWMALNVGHFRTGVTIGLHGTDVPQLIGKPVSDGCIRMRNSDVELVFKLLKIGTPVIISNQ